MRRVALRGGTIRDGMTTEELFDAYRQVVSERDQLRRVGDDLWNELENCREFWER